MWYIMLSILCWAHAEMALALKLHSILLWRCQNRSVVLTLCIPWWCKSCQASHRSFSLLGIHGSSANWPWTFVVFLDGTTGSWMKLVYVYVDSSLDHDFTVSARAFLCWDQSAKAYKEGPESVEANGRKCSINHGGCRRCFSLHI